MYSIRTRARHLAAATLAIGLGATMTGCHGKATTPGGGATIQRTAAASAAPAGLHGLVAVDTPDPTNTGVNVVDVFDPKTGHSTQTLQVGFGLAQDAVFSPDWSLVATDMPSISGPHGITLGRRSGDTYSQIGTWAPQASLGGGLQQYSNPVFNRADGRVWFARRGIYEAQPSSDDVWFSVDPAQPTGAPRQEQQAPPTTDPAGRVVQPQQLTLGVEKASPDTVAKVTTSSSGLLSATVEGSLLPSEDPDPAHALLLYKCKQRISAQELLCVGDGEQDGAGAVVGLSVPAPGKNAVLRRIFPPAAGGTSIVGAFLSPDGTSVLLGSQNGWFVGPVTGSSAPTQAFAALDHQTLAILGWY